MVKYIYRVQGLEQDFATKKEAFRQARNLGAVIRECCERLGEKFDGIQVTQHERIGESNVTDLGT